MYYCKWHIYFWLVVAILFLLSSCQQGEVDVNAYKSYFNTENHMEFVLDSLLERDSTSIHLVLNGKHEDKTLQGVDSSLINEMIELIEEANLNDKLLTDLYTIDTFWLLDENQQNIEVVNYEAKDEQQKVKWLQVYANGDIKALLQQKNVLFSYEKEVFYGHNGEFSLFAWQKALQMDTLFLYKQLTIN